MSGHERMIVRPCSQLFFNGENRRGPREPHQIVKGEISSFCGYIENFYAA